MNHCFALVNQGEDVVELHFVNKRGKGPGWRPGLGPFATGGCWKAECKASPMPISGPSQTFSRNEHCTSERSTWAALALSLPPPYLLKRCQHVSKKWCWWSMDCSRFFSPNPFDKPSPAPTPIALHSLLSQTFSPTREGLVVPSLLLAPLDFALILGNMQKGLPWPFTLLSDPEEKLQGASWTVAASMLLLGIKTEAPNPHTMKYFLRCKYMCLKKKKAFYSSCWNFSHGKGKTEKKHWQITYFKTGKKILKCSENLYMELF